MLNRYKIIINKEIEHHNDAINEHVAISNALSILRADGYMLPVKSIAIDCIANNQS